MGALLAFLFERMVVSTPDIIMVGGGMFLLAKSRGQSRIGYALLVFYALGIIGLSMQPVDPWTPVSGEPWFVQSPVFGVLGGVAGYFAGVRERAKKTSDVR